METPIQELIKQLEDLRDSIPDEDAMYRGGVINSIRLAEGMLEREKSSIKSIYNRNINTLDLGMMQQFGEDWAEDYYNKTFKNKQI